MVESYAQRELLSIKNLRLALLGVSPSARRSVFPFLSQTLGDRIRKWRLERGLFQRDLAKKIGVSEMTIVNWEKGRTKPIKQNIEKLEKILGN